MNKITLSAFLIISLISQNTLGQPKCNIDDWTALKALYNSTNGDKWINRTGWEIQIEGLNAPQESCDLTGLYGLDLNEEGRVTKVNLNENGLTGIIPSELENLTFLQILNLSNNQLTGQIPVEISTLTNLKSLFLTNAALSGGIPKELSNLTNMKYLHLSKNDLRGNIPDDLSNLSNLIGLHLNKCNLTGSIPPALAEMHDLEVLQLTNNNLTGAIPTQFGSFNSLTELNLRGNNLSGIIPTELSALSKLNKLVLSGNELTGSIPKELAQLAKLDTLKLTFNQLSGCFEPDLQRLCAQLSESLIYEGNKFTTNWEDFCGNCEGACVSGSSNSIMVPTNYSGCVELALDNGQDILKNNAAKVFDYSTCSDFTDIDNCNPVTGFDNLAANEAFWVATQAAEYLSSKFDITIPPVDIIVNNTKPDEINGAYFSPLYNIIFLGKGDNLERTAMAAPDIVAHEYLHFLQQNLGDFFSPLIKEKESGSLRESIADIFGEIIERYCYGENDWIFGSQIFTSESNKQGIRSLRNPKDISMQSITPDTYLQNPWVKEEQICDHSNNKCGIHINCGVHNHWFYTLTNLIDMEAATDIVFKNFTENLNSNTNFKDAAIGSVQANKELYVNNAEQQRKVIKAWKEVGIDLNFIEWALIQTKVNSGDVLDEVQFDLVIDSAGQDLSADGLHFTLHLEEDYQELTKEDIMIYPPLTKDEVTIEVGAYEININVKRRPNLNAQNKKGAIQKIPSNTPILGSVFCIPVVDSGEAYCYKPLQISGHTQIIANNDIIFEPDKLYLGSCINEKDGIEGFSLLYTSLDISQKTCNSLGTVKLDALDYNLNNSKSFIFTLFKDDIQIRSANSQESSYQFNELDKGNYTIILTNDKNGKANIQFEIGIIAEANGSICCPEDLTIAPGIVEGSYNATNTISFEKGSLIKNGVFEICDE